MRISPILLTVLKSSLFKFRPLVDIPECTFSDAKNHRNNKAQPSKQYSAAKNVINYARIIRKYAASTPYCPAVLRCMPL